MVDTFNIDDYRALKDLMVDKTQPLDKRLKQYVMDVKKSAHGTSWRYSCTN